jgi:RecB family exonuclease
VAHSSIGRSSCCSPIRPNSAHRHSDGCFDQAVAEYATDPEFTLLHLDQDQQQAFVDGAWKLVEAYFRMEDPTAVREIGIELRLKRSVRWPCGIIDRLELDADGGLIVTDYKTAAHRAEVRTRQVGRRSLLFVPV